VVRELRAFSLFPFVYFAVCAPACETPRSGALVRDAAAPRVGSPAEDAIAGPEETGATVDAPGADAALAEDTALIADGAPAPDVAPADAATAADARPGGCAFPQAGRPCNGCGGVFQCDGSCPKPKGNFGPAVLLDINSEAQETGMWLSPDGMAVYFESTRAGGKGRYDLWTARRATPGDAFRPATLVANLNTAVDDMTAWLSPDERRIYFQTGDLVGELQIASRADTSAPFGRPARIPGLYSGSNETTPWLTENELRIYFATGRGKKMDIYLANRSTRDEAFTNARPVPGLDSDDNEISIAVSPDERTIFFGSDRPGGKGLGDVWMAERGGRDAPFVEVVNVAAINGPSEDLPAFLSRDECTLYFASDRDGGVFDLYATTRAAR
jgi:hypothetical protein